MPDNWQPSGPWKQRFRKALDEAFDEPSMEMLTTDYFSPSHAFSKISPAGIGKTFEFRLFELIKQAQMEDWLPEPGRGGQGAAAQEPRHRHNRRGPRPDDHRSEAG